MIINMELSKEEINLYNPAYVGTVIYQAIRECMAKNPAGLHCSLVYLVAPLALSGRYSSILPASILSPIAGWASENEGDLVGFSQSANAYIDIVNLAIAFLLERDAIYLSDDGFFLVKNNSMPNMPAMVNNNVHFKKSFLSAGFLGRWFGQSPSVEAIYTYLGVIP